MYADQVKVKQYWYEPLFPPREDRQLEMAMVREWKEFMSYEDSYSCGWTTRLIAYVLLDIPGGYNGRTAQVAATFALWCMTNNGRGFLDPVLRKIRSSKGENRANIAVGAWAVENQLGLPTTNRLEVLVGYGQGHQFKQHPYPTLSDNRAVEQTLKFFVSDPGLKFLERVCRASSRTDWLPL